MCAAGAADAASVVLIAEGVPLAVSTIDCMPVFTPAALLADDGVCVDWIAAAFGLYLMVAGMDAVSAGMGVVAVLMGVDVEVVPAAGGDSVAPDETVLAGVVLDLVTAFCLLDLAAWFRLADVTCTSPADCHSMKLWLFTFVSQGVPRTSSAGSSFKGGYAHEYILRQR